jgi:CheY-like chemotaxis protein
MPLIINRSTFIASLREALSNLYDPYKLKRSPLQAILSEPLIEKGIDLKQFLTNSINALMPEDHTPYDTKAWKVFELLNFSFIDQMDQRETAKNMLLGLRTVQRLAPEAIETLAEQIAVDNHITFSSDETMIEQKPIQPVSSPRSNENWVKEAEFQKSQYQGSLIDIHQTLRELSQLLLPIYNVGQSSIEILFPEGTWFVIGQVTLLRQAVLTALSLFSNCPDCRITISTEQRGNQGEIRINGHFGDEATIDQNQTAETDIMNALSNLMQILKGRVAFYHRSPNELAINLSLPIQQQYNIMVIDDNADVVHLIEEYLSDSIYKVTGIKEPERVINEIEKNKPSIVLLDVMLPNIDGWMLLSQIRHNPAILRIPVVVCTLLPQERLSFSLGADAFLRKPFTQQELLEVLNAQILMNQEQPKAPKDIE